MVKKIGIDISVLNDPKRSGVAVYVYQLIEALLKINKKDQFILFGLSPYASFENLSRLDFKKYPNVKMKLYKMPARLFRLIFLIWQKINWPPIENLIGSVDIFHSFNWYLPAQRKGKVVATVFDMTPILLSKFHLEKTIQLDTIRLKRIKKYADLVIAISQNSKKDFLKFAPEKKVEVIYPGVGDNFLNKKVDKSEQVLAKYNLKRGYILSVGTIEPRKNLERVILAFAKLASQGATLRGYELVIAGAKGWMSNQVYQLPKKLGIEDKIKFIGRVSDEDLVALYKNAFCLLYPSLYEGFGIPIIEAQVCGCPVITSSVSSLPEVGGKAAIYVDPYSVEDIVKGIREIEEIREKLIKEGYKNTKRFSWEESAKKLNLLYQRL